MKKRIGAMLTALALVGAMLPSAMAVELDKSATDLTENDKTTVTLTVGANQDTVAADVVFVLDKSTSTDVKKEALAMLNELQNRATEENLAVNVGVVTFNNNAANEGYNLPLRPLDDESITEIENIFNMTLSSGTNIEAGIRAGIDMLGASSIPDSNKHLVLVTDGVTYIWGEETPQTIYNEFPHHDGQNLIWSSNSLASGVVDKAHFLITQQTYVDSFADPAQWLEDNAEIASVIETYGVEWTSEGANSTTYISYDTNIEYTANDAAIYQAGLAWQEAEEAGYNLYSFVSTDYVPAGGSLNQEGYYPWAVNFFSNLNEIGGSATQYDDTSTGVSGMFDGVENSILYEIQSGTVADPIGEYYIFDGLDTVTLTVGDAAATLDENVIGDYDISFNNGSYGVNYDETGRVLTWDINTPVEQGKAVALSYGLTVDQSKVPTNGTVVAPTNGETTLTYEPTTGGEETEEFDVPEFTLGEKESIPTPDKEADGKDEIGNVATGDIIPFTITTTLPETIVGTEAEEHTMLIFRDTMTGLELVDDTIELTINGETIPAEYYDFEDASTADPEYFGSGNTFAVAVDLSEIDASDYGPLENLGGGSVVLSYKGKVTADMGSEVNNEAWVNDSNSDTTPGKVTIETGGSGTLMFTLGGAALLAAASALFVVNRRKNSN